MLTLSLAKVWTTFCKETMSKMPKKSQGSNTWKVEMKAEICWLLLFDFT